MRIAIVDNNVDAADTLAALLRSRGHEVLVQYDGASAIKAIRAFAPALVLVELRLRGVSGFALAQALRADDRPPALVALTIIPEAEDAAIAAGFDRFLPKPASLEQLNEVIESVESSST